MTNGKRSPAVIRPELRVDRLVDGPEVDHDRPLDEAEGQPEEDQGARGSGSIDGPSPRRAHATTPGLIRSQGSLDLLDRRVERRGPGGQADGLERGEPGGVEFGGVLDVEGRDAALPQSATSSLVLFEFRPPTTTIASTRSSSRSSER